MKAWPEFDAHGDMPPGIHLATLAEVVAHFGSGTPQRQRVARRLEHIYALAKASGHLARFIVARTSPLVAEAIIPAQAR